MMVSPGYSYAKAPDQDHFLRRNQTANLFQRLLARPKRSWQFNQTPLFLEFLQGRFDLECTPWGSPTYNIFGWQKPCYLVDEGHVTSFRELMETTDWSRYGRQSGNSKCQDCMVHCGYEPSAVEATFGTLKGFLRTAKLTVFGLPKNGKVAAELPSGVDGPHSIGRPHVPAKKLQLLQIGERVS
jgi:hypothetical protein